MTKPDSDFQLIYSKNKLFKWVEVYYSTRRGWCISQRGQLRYFPTLGAVMSFLVSHRLIDDEATTWEILRLRSDRLDDEGWKNRFDPFEIRWYVNK